MHLSLKVAACASVILMLTAGSSFARDPRDVGEQQTQCIAQGGDFSVGDNKYEYDCSFDDDTTWTCDFSGTEPDCDTDFGAAEVDTNPFDDD